MAFCHSQSKFVGSPAEEMQEKEAEAQSDGAAALLAAG